MEHDIDATLLDLSAHDTRLGRVPPGTSVAGSLLPLIGGKVEQFSSLEDAPKDGKLVAVGTKAAAASTKTVRLLVLRRSTNEILADVRRFSWQGCNQALPTPIEFRCIPQDDITLEMERWVCSPTNPSRPRHVREGIPHSRMVFHVQH